MVAHDILGEQVQMPVDVRAASACSAMFLVPATAAAGVAAEAGLTPAQPLPGRALCSLAFVRYTDCDLGPYHEFAVALLTRHDGRRSGRGAFIHWLPVNQEFTLWAGRSIWGFPKELAEIDIRLAGRQKRCVVRQDGRLVLALHVRRGIPVPSGSGATAIDAYTALDGCLRRTPWSMRPSRVRARPGGVRLRLGSHPAADRLRALGLPGTALAGTEIGTLRMTFHEARQIR